MAKLFHIFVRLTLQPLRESARVSVKGERARFTNLIESRWNCIRESRLQIGIASLEQNCTPSREELTMFMESLEEWKDTCWKGEGSLKYFRTTEKELLQADAKWDTHVN